MTRVLVVAQSALVRAGLEAVLSAGGGHTIVGSSDRQRPLGELVATTAPDVVLVALAGLDAPPMLDLSPDAAALAPALVVIAPLGDAAWTARALTAGARGVLLPDPRPEEIVAAIEAVAHGLTVVSSPLVNTLRATTRAPQVSPPSAVSLSPREHEVLQLLADGYPNKQVAARLGLSEHTVKTHITSVFDKLEVSTRAEAVARAVRLGLLVL